MIQIRRALTTFEVRECLRMRDEHLISNHNIPSYLKKDIYDDTAIHVLAKKGGVSVGCARVILHPCDTAAVISSLAVAPRYQHLGIGSRMLRALELAPELLHVESLLLDAKISAVPFYESHGYKVTSDEFFAYGSRCCRMEKIRVCLREKAVYIPVPHEDIPLFLH